MKTKVKKIIISLVGKPLAGKGTFASFFEQKLPPGITLGSHRFSDPLGESLKLLGLPLHRTNYQLLPQVLNSPLNYSLNPSAWFGSPTALLNLENVEPVIQTLELFGVPNHPDHPQNIATFVRYLAEPTIQHNRLAWEGLSEEETKSILANTVKRRALADPNPIVMLDGARWLVDEKMLRSLPPDIVSILVYITADPDKRFGWQGERKIKAGEAEMTRDQFDLADQAETEIYIPQIGSRADYVIENNGTKEELQEKVAEFYKTKIEPVLALLG